jgi:hypothetical protein
MAVPRPLLGLGKLALVGALLAPPAAVWLSGRFGREGGPQVEAPAGGPLATLPRSETSATPAERPPPAPDVAPAPAPSVTVGAGRVPVPPPAPGAAAVPAARSGRVVGEPQGLPDPSRSEATPR